MIIKPEQRSHTNSWITTTPVNNSHDKRLTESIRHLDTRFFITPWLNRIQRLINTHSR